MGKELTTGELLELGRLQEELLTLQERIDNEDEGTYLTYLRYRLDYISGCIRTIEKI